MDKINVIPENVRGLGNVVIPKSTEDFIEYLSVISSDTESVNNVDMTVYSLNYSSTAISVTLTSSSSTITIGESVLLTATVTQGGEPLEGGTVTFYDGQTSLGTATTNSSGVATKTFTGASGTHSLTAKAGNVTSSAVTVTVSKVTTTITLSTSSASVSVSETFTLSGTLSAGTGKSVKIYNGSTLVDTVTTGTGGAYTKQLSESTAGTYTFTAVFDGDSTYANVTSSAVTVAVSDVPTPEPASMTLTSDKSILSYYDSQSATLTATVYDDNDDPLEGQVVEFFKGSTSMGTSTTNSSGVATKTYTSAGSGDIVISAECSSLTQTYELEDCTYYSTTEYSGTSGATLNIPLPNHFTLEYILKQTNTSSSVPYLDIGNASNDRMLVGQYARAGSNGLIVYKSSSTTHAYGTNTTPNQDNTIWFKWDGTKYYYKLNTGNVMEVSNANVTLSKLIHIEAGIGGSLRNIKIKPL